jgi:hypothetical protein
MPWGADRERASPPPTETVKRVQSMKFPHLQPGQRFRWQDQVYSKTGPLTAVAEADGKTRMFSRSAVVAPLDGSTQKPTVGLLEPDRVRMALDAMTSQLEDAVQTLAKDAGAEHAETVRRAVEKAKQQFIEQTGI